MTVTNDSAPSSIYVGHRALVLRAQGGDAQEAADGAAAEPHGHAQG